MPNRIISTSIIVIMIATQAISQRLYTEETITRKGMSDKETVTTVKTWYSENQLRKEDANQIQILDFMKKSMYILDSNKKSYIAFESQTFEQMNKSRVNKFPIEKDTNGKSTISENLFNLTGKKKTIGKWNCYEVKLDLSKGPMKSELTEWWTEDTDLNLSDYIKVFKANNFMMGADFNLVLTQLSKLKGYPVATETTLHFGNNVIRTFQELVKYEKLKFIETAKFEVPSDYVKSDFNFPQMGEKVSETIKKAITEKANNVNGPGAPTPNSKQ